MASELSKSAVDKLPPALRLQASREKLRDAMTPPPEPPAPPPPPPNAVQQWLSSLHSVPVVGEVAQSVGAWWVKHPFRPVAKMAGEAAAAAVEPVAQRHPKLFVGASAAVGALLVISRPWRWALRSALFAGLVPQLASRIIAKLPLRSWLTMLGTVAGSAVDRTHRASVVVPTPNYPLAQPIASPAPPRV